MLNIVVGTMNLLKISVRDSFVNKKKEITLGFSTEKFTLGSWGMSIERLKRQNGNKW